ncbi:hypothetical protein E8E13_007068 [Curvularia kusanoi]|uniref:Uncharacterized protein n=1 Tax=Curvularia kusanoi TaxID=90978 RepID=A0A9P4W967_CURKU|nr:hypothetical protein E8E13_007068 [Curvularia kusanoi]
MEQTVRRIAKTHVEIGGVQAEKMCFSRLESMTLGDDGVLTIVARKCNLPVSVQPLFKEEHTEAERKTFVSLAMCMNLLTWNAHWLAWMHQELKSAGLEIAMLEYTFTKPKPVHQVYHKYVNQAMFQKIEFWHTTKSMGGIKDFLELSEQQFEQELEDILAKLQEQLDDQRSALEAVEYNAIGDQAREDGLEKLEKECDVAWNSKLLAWVLEGFDIDLREKSFAKPIPTKKFEMWEEGQNQPDQDRWHTVLTFVPKSGGEALVADPSHHQYSWESGIDKLSDFLGTKVERTSQDVDWDFGNVLDLQSELDQDNFSRTLSDVVAKTTCNVVVMGETEYETAKGQILAALDRELYDLRVQLDDVVSDEDLKDLEAECEGPGHELCSAAYERIMANGF